MGIVAGLDSSPDFTRIVVCDTDTGAVLRQGFAPHPVEHTEGGGRPADVDPQAWLLSLGEAAGGGLLDVGIYPLSFAPFVLGPVEAVQASAEIGPTGVDVHTVFNLRHAGGRLAQGLCSLRATTACLATVLGTAGRIDVTPPFYAAQQLRVVRGAGPSELAPVEVIDRPWRGSPYVAQVEEVHRCLRAGLAESPVMPLDESVALVGWMDAMRAQVGLRYPMD